MRNDASDSGVQVHDPEPNQKTLKVKLTADDLVVASYVKLFRALGLPSWVMFSVEKRVPSLPSALIDKISEKVLGVPMVYIGRVANTLFGLQSGIAKILFATPDQEEIHRRISEKLAKHEIWNKPQTTDHLVLPNGIIAGETDPTM